MTPKLRHAWRGPAPGGANPGAVGEPAQKRDQGKWGEDGEPDQGHARGDAEDVAGVAERIVDSPATSAWRCRRRAGLDSE